MFNFLPDFGKLLSPVVDSVNGVVNSAVSSAGDALGGFFGGSKVPKVPVPSPAKQPKQDVRGVTIDEPQRSPKSNNTVMYVAGGVVGLAIIYFLFSNK